MNRVRIAAALSVLLGGTSTLAAPPTEGDWWQGMDNYVNSFEMMSDENPDEVAGTFTMRWTVPFQRTQFNAVGVSGSGDGAGWVAWNPATSRPEFHEVLNGPEGQSMLHGFMVDMTGQTITWEATEWNKDGEVRTFRVADTFNATGMNRKATVLSGKEMPESFAWRRRNHFLEHCPVAESMVGLWVMTTSGSRTLTEVSFGPGKQSLQVTTHRIDPGDALKFESAATWRYDAVTGGIVIDVVNNDGLIASCRPTFEHDGDQHTVNMAFEGRDNFGNAISLTMTDVLEGDSLSRRIGRFEFMGVTPPGMEDLIAQMPPQVMKRQK